MANTAPLEVLADPTRRLLVERLCQGPASVTQLLAVVPVSQPAVSQHLAVLRQARLVSVQKRGNQRIYQLDPLGLSDLRSYVESLWDVVLQSFQQAADQLNAEEETRDGRNTS